MFCFTLGGSVGRISVVLGRMGPFGRSSMSTSMSNFPISFKNVAYQLQALLETYRDRSTSCLIIAQRLEYVRIVRQAQSSLEILIMNFCKASKFIDNGLYGGI